MLEYTFTISRMLKKLVPVFPAGRRTGSWERGVGGSIPIKYGVYVSPIKNKVNFSTEEIKRTTQHSLTIESKLCAIFGRKPWIRRLSFVVNPLQTNVSNACRLTYSTTPITMKISSQPIFKCSRAIIFKPSGKFPRNGSLWRERGETSSSWSRQPN